MNYIRFDADRFLFLFLFLFLILGLDFFLTNSITNLLVYEIVLVFSFRTIRVSSQRQPGHVEMLQLPVRKRRERGRNDATERI